MAQSTLDGVIINMNPIRALSIHSLNISVPIYSFLALGSVV